MAIRVYRRPLPASVHYAGQPNNDPRLLREMPFEEIFVVLEDPLLEFTQKDLAFLRERGIDPFRD
jgi:hypothetical protein